MSKVSSRPVWVNLSKTERAQVLGQHVQDRLYRDRRYRQKFLQDAGPAVCTRCGAVSLEKRWYADSGKSQTVTSNPQVRHVLCPGCHRVEDGVHEGEVILESPLLNTEKDVVMNLIKHTGEKCWHDNPMSRVATITDTGNRLQIRTTTRWLATRIGKEIQKAYSGELDIKPSPREKFVRVYWKRGQS